MLPDLLDTFEEDIIDVYIDDGKDVEEELLNKKDDSQDFEGQVGDGTNKGNSGGLEA